MSQPRDYGPERTHLIRAREMLKLERPQLAEILGVRRDYVFRVEKGQRNPSLAMMTRWVQALGPYGAMELFLDWPAPAEQQKPAA